MMNRTKTDQFIEYLSPTLILSYFLFHNIFLVLVGISLSLYLININFIINLKNLIYKHLFINKESKIFLKEKKIIKSTAINIKSTKEAGKLSLVEEIEELGYIPSVDKNNDINAA